MSKQKTKKPKPETGGLQEKKVKVELTPEEVKEEKKVAKQKQKEKAAKATEERKKNRVGFITRIKEVFGELKKVNWPTFSRTMKQTGVVMGVVVVFALVVFGIDRGLGELFKLLTRGLTE